MDLISQSTSLFGSLKNAVLGNPVTREFSIGSQIGSFGPGLLWKVFEGKKKTTGQDVSVFIFEKSLVDKYGRRDKEEIFQKMRHGPQQLTKLRHPRILTVQHPLEESRDSLAFATEPVFASLSNVFGKHENFPSGMPSQLKLRDLGSVPEDSILCTVDVVGLYPNIPHSDGLQAIKEALDKRDVKSDFELFAVEKVYGLLQIAEGLAFLHNDAKLCEGNITPDNIILTNGGQWKLAGFHFSASTTNPNSQREYTTQIPPQSRQDLNYLAPEYIFAHGGAVGFDLGKADMFSFGCLISAVYNHLKTPFDAGDNIASYKKCTEQLSRLGSDYLKNVPTEIRDHVSLLLNAAGETRPDASLTLTHRFFDDVAAMTLKYLDSLVQRDDVTKSQFFKNLSNVLDKLPLRVLQQRILPPLFSEFPNHMMIPFVLPNVFMIAEKSSKEDYTRLVFPELKKIFDIVEPIQVLLIFMQKMELMLKMTDKGDIKNYVLPLVFKALEAPSEEIQELVLTIIPNFVHMIDYSSLKNAIIPRIKVLITKNKSLRVRVNALVCLGKIIDHLDKFLIVDEIFPIFPQVPSKEPAVLMAILGIYKQTLRQSKISLEKDYLATNALPFLLPLSVEPTLNVSQFNNFMSVIREMFDRVEQEHRTKLEQLQKMQDEQRSSIDFVKAANKNVDTGGTDSMMSKVDDLVVGRSSEGVTKKTIGANSEFAKMFGLSDESKRSTTTGSLMGNTQASPSNSKKLDISSFDTFSSPSSTNKSFDRGSSTSSTNQNRGISQNNNQVKHSAMFDSMMNSQLNNMNTRQQSTSFGNTQNMGLTNPRSPQLTQQAQYQQNFNSGYPSKPHAGMSSGVMQNQTQHITMFQSQTQMYMPNQQQPPMSNMNSAMSSMNPTMPSGHNMNTMNQNSMQRNSQQMNSGILQPMNNTGILAPMNSGHPKSNLSNKDLDDLLM